MKHLKSNSWMSNVDVGLSVIKAIMGLKNKWAPGSQGIGAE